MYKYIAILNLPWMFNSEHRIVQSNWEYRQTERNSFPKNDSVMWPSSHRQLFSIQQSTELMIITAVSHLPYILYTHPIYYTLTLYIICRRRGPYLWLTAESSKTISVRTPLPADSSILRIIRLQSSSDLDANTAEWHGYSANRTDSVEPELELSEIK